MRSLGRGMDRFDRNRFRRGAVKVVSGALFVLLVLLPPTVITIH